MVEGKGAPWELHGKLYPHASYIVKKFPTMVKDDA
jgi:hypothetical protein